MPVAQTCLISLPPGGCPKLMKSKKNATLTIQARQYCSQPGHLTARAKGTLKHPSSPALALAQMSPAAKSMANSCASQTPKAAQNSSSALCGPGCTLVGLESPSACLNQAQGYYHWCGLHEVAKAKVRAVQVGVGNTRQAVFPPPNWDLEDAHVGPMQPCSPPCSPPASSSPPRLPSICLHLASLHPLSREPSLLSVVVSPPCYLLS